MTAPITVLRDTHPLPVLDACKWEKLEGDPHTVNLNAYTSEDGSKIMGTWICTPGASACGNGRGGPAAVPGHEPAR